MYIDECLHLKNSSCKVDRGGGPYKNFCSIAFNDWTVLNPGKTITIKNIPNLTHRAYLKVFTSENIIKSFKPWNLANE